MAQLDHVKDKLDETISIVLVHKAGANPDDPTHR